MQGGACLSKFVPALRELRDAGEMLHMQTDVALCERLQPWAEVGTQHRHVQPGLWLTNAYRNLQLLVLVHVFLSHVYKAMRLRTWLQSLEGCKALKARSVTRGA